MFVTEIEADSEAESVACGASDGAGGVDVGEVIWANTANVAGMGVVWGSPARKGACWFVAPAVGGE